MKISEMSANQAADALVKLSQPVANVLDDPEVGPLIDELSKSRNIPPLKIISSLLPKVCAVALKKHRRDFFEIVGALDGKSATDVGKMPVLKVVEVVKESVDKDLIDFFSSSGDQTKMAGTESVSS